jgi:hypothetical protein
MTTVGLVAVQVEAPVCTNVLGTEVLIPRRTFVAVSLHTAQARVTLSADAHPIAYFDAAFGFAAYAYSSADDLVADTNGIRSRAL